MTEQLQTHDPEVAGMTPAVLAQLVQSHARFLAFLERRVGTHEAAEEILQEAFVRALARGDSLRSDESATAWFYRLLRNALVDHHRRRAAERRALDRAAVEPTAPLDEPLMQTVCACMHALLDTLKPEYAAAVRQVDLGEQSLTQYAQGAGITANNASVRLHRAREALFRRLVASCGTCATHGCLDCRCKQPCG
jgi:RNA polymerase sigma factor (sigma-70 family)